MTKNTKKDWAKFQVESTNKFLQIMMLTTIVMLKIGRSSRPIYEIVLRKHYMNKVALKRKNSQ